MRDVSKHIPDPKRRREHVAVQLDARRPCRRVLDDVERGVLIDEDQDPRDPTESSPVPGNGNLDRAALQPYGAQDVT